MQIKKSITSFILIGILAAHVSVRIMAKDAYLISFSDHPTQNEESTASDNSESEPEFTSASHVVNRSSSGSGIAVMYCPAP